MVCYSILYVWVPSHCYHQEGRDWHTRLLHTLNIIIYCNFCHRYYTYSLSALLLLLMWSLSSAFLLIRCTLCASYSMRIIEWISICGTYVRAWLLFQQVSVNYGMGVSEWAWNERRSWVWAQSQVLFILSPLPCAVMSRSTLVTFPPVATFFQTVQSHLCIYDCNFYSIAASSQTCTEGCVYWITLL